ncbi:MAG: MATE family efflux transporter [Desulfobacteraceae bacterium]|nr:MATE family efflux transporter [Desulfobacteraceae bacterium]
MADSFPSPDAACLGLRQRGPETAQTSWTEMWRLSWPLVGSMLLQFSVGLTDVYVAGRFSPQVQGAVGFASQLLFFFTVIANALGVGLVAVIARRQGACEIAALWQAARHGVLLALLLTAPVSLLGFVWLPRSLLRLALPPSELAPAMALMPWYALSLLPEGVLVVASAVFRARGQTLLVLLASAVAAGLNLPAVFGLAFGLWGLPALGPSGIAIATALSSLAGGAVSLAILFRQGLGRGGWGLEAALARRLLQLGWPAGLLQAGWQLGSLVLYAILGQLPLEAVAATAALTNGLRIEAILYLPAYALNMVSAVLVGQALGANNEKRAEQSGWRLAGAGGLILTLLALPIFVWSRELAGLITPDPKVRELTHLYLRFNMVSQPFMAVGVCLGGGLEGAGDTRGTMQVVLGALWAVRLPLAAALALLTPLRATGVWLAMVVSMVLQCLLMMQRFRRGRWKEIRIFGGEKLS